jgi:hypothetical protein
MANVCLPTLLATFASTPLRGSRLTYIDLSILKSLLQILIDGLVGDFTQQSEIRNSDLLLFRGIIGGLLNVWLPAGGSGTTARLRRGALVLRPPTNSLLSE